MKRTLDVCFLPGEIWVKNYIDKVLWFSIHIVVDQKKISNLYKGLNNGNNYCYSLQALTLLMNIF
jgi:hypothetical protein